MSPELIAPQRFGLKNTHHTKSSDCYALGMVIYEIISGKLPFHEDADLTVFLKVVEGEHPPRGTRFTKGLWEMLEQCWVSLPNNRPNIEDVLQCLEMVSNFSELPSYGTDEEMENNSDGWDTESSSSGADEEMQKDSANQNLANSSHSVSNWMGGMKTTRRSIAMSSGSSHLAQVTTTGPTYL